MNTTQYIIVLPRTEADLDGIACAVAYAELLNIQGTPAKPWFMDEPDAEARFLIDMCKGVQYANSTEVLISDKFILVDASGLEGLPTEVNPTNVIEVVDHRFHNNAQSLFPNAKIQIESVGAAATLVTEKFIDANKVPSYESGLMLYGAIHSNTQCLKGTITSQRDIIASAWLLREVEIPMDFLDKQFEARRNDLVKDVKESIRRERKEYSHSSGRYAIAQLEFHGSGKILNEKLGEIKTVIKELSPRTALNMVDLESNCSYILCLDADLRKLIESKLQISFRNDIATTNGIILRKQIIDKIQD